MPNWKKLIYSGSAAVLSNVSASSYTGSFTGSFSGTFTSASFASTASITLNTVTGTNSTNLVYGNMADNDQFRIRIGGTATNGGFVEIATADDGTEPIYVRQYTGVFTSLTRTATLLDGSGNTSFPGGVTATTFTGSLSGSVAGTASFATTAQNLLGSVTSASFASTASFVNTLNQRVLITSSAAIGTSSLGPSENTLTLGARDTSNEGGQLGINAPGGTYTSASFIDLYQNKLRILKGTNAGSTSEAAWWSMHDRQMALPAYTSTSAFPGTAVAVLSVDTSGNVLTSSPVISFNNQGASYTLASTDADKLVEMNSAAPNTLTVPTNASVPIAVGTQFMVVQQNTGPTTIAPAGGVTLNSAGGLLNLANQYSAATLVKRAVDEWYVFGDLA